MIIKEFPNIAASVNALTAEQVDGMFTGTATVRELLAQHTDFTASEKITSGKTAFPVPQDRPKLLDAMNNQIEAMIKDGTYARLFYKWNDAEIPIPGQLVAEHPGMPTAAPSAGSAFPTQSGS